MSNPTDQEHQDQQNTEPQGSWENARENWEQLEAEEQKKGWDHWDSNASQSSYYNQPTHTPYDQAFGIASTVFGMLAITLGCCGLSIPFGALGCIFALLTYRKGKKLSPNSHLGVTLSVVGIIGGIIYLIYLVYMTFNNPAFMEQMNQTSQMLYGMDFEEMLRNAYGISPQ